MVNVFPRTGKEGETSRKHGAAVLGLIASHVYSRSAIIQMRVQIQLHRDACTNTVAHIKLLMQSWTQFLMYSCSRLLLYCTHMLLHSCILVLMYIQALQSLSVRNPWPSGPQQGVSSCIISFDRIWKHKFKQECQYLYTSISTNEIILFHLHPAIRQGNPVLAGSRISCLCLLMKKYPLWLHRNTKYWFPKPIQSSTAPQKSYLVAMVVPVVRSFHTVDELIVCLFLTKQVQRQNVPLCEGSLNQWKISE